MVDKKENKVEKPKVIKREITHSQEQLNKVSEMVDQI